MTAGLQSRTETGQTAGVMMPLDERMLRQGAAELAARDPALAAMLETAGPLRLRRRDPGFAGLIAVVISQQVSTASAEAIRKRVAERFPDLRAEHVQDASDEDLRRCGLSAPKMRTLRAAAEAVLAGALPIDALSGMTAEEAHARLVAIRGIGPWTADIYLLFCLGHADAFPAGDLALQEAVRIGYGLPTRPAPAQLTALAEGWRPWRGVAAKLLWAYYGVVKGRSGTPDPVGPA